MYTCVHFRSAATKSFRSAWVRYKLLHLSGHLNFPQNSDFEKAAKIRQKSKSDQSGRMYIKYLKDYNY